MTIDETGVIEIGTGSIDAEFEQVTKRLPGDGNAFGRMKSEIIQ